MSFLFSLDGLIYNVPGVLVLALLLWKRPYIGIVMAGYAFIRVWGPMLGIGELLNASAHMSLGVVTALAWTWGRRGENIVLFVAGVALLAFTLSTVGWLLPDTEKVAVALQRGTFIGVGLTMCRFLANGAVAFMRKKSPTTPEQA